MTQCSVKAQGQLYLYLYPYPVKDMNIYHTQHLIKVHETHYERHDTGGHVNLALVFCHHQYQHVGSAKAKKASAINVGR